MKTKTPRKPKGRGALEAIDQEGQPPQVLSHETKENIREGAVEMGRWSQSVTGFFTYFRTRPELGRRSVRGGS